MTGTELVSDALGIQHESDGCFHGVRLLTPAVLVTVAVAVLFWLFPPLLIVSGAAGSTIDFASRRS